MFECAFESTLILLSLPLLLPYYFDMFTYKALKIRIWYQLVTAALYLTHHKEYGVFSIYRGDYWVSA